MSDELKPCPFCGSDKISYYEREYIECCNCCCRLPWEELTDENGNKLPDDYIIDSWNDRYDRNQPVKVTDLGAGYVIRYACGKCGSNALPMYSNYCFHCGVSLDWSEIQDIGNRKHCEYAECSCCNIKN